jgi:signal transduction histidine kinase
MNDATPEPAALAVEQLLLRFAHHAFTPLHQAGGALELAAHGTLDEQARTQVDAAGKGVRQAMRLTRNLLCLVDGASHHLTSRSTDVAVVLDALAGRWRVAAAAERSLLVVDALELPDEATLMVDDQVLAQVLDELVDNAIAHAPGSVITLSATADEHGASITVTDDGRGIDPVFLPHALEAFTVGPSDGRREPGGLGIGLAVAVELVTRLGARLTLVPAEDGGTAATVSLPR